MKIILFITEGSGDLDKKRVYQLDDFVDIPSAKEGWRCIYTDDKSERALWIHSDSERPQEYNAWQRPAEEEPPPDDIEEVLVAVHQGSGLDHDKVKETARDAFEGIPLHFVTFSREPGYPVWKHLARFISARGADDESGADIPDAFDELADAIRKKKRTPEISRLKHRLSHCLLPIDIDLQGWEESGFNDEYRQEIVEAYQDGAGRKHLEEAKKLIYGTEGDETEANKAGKTRSVETIVNEVLEESEKKDDEIEEEWDKVKVLFPKDIDCDNGEGGHSKFAQARRLVCELEGGGDLSSLKKELNSSPASNPFHEWLEELETATDKLRKKLL